MGVKQGNNDIVVNGLLYSASGITRTSVLASAGYNMEIKVDWSFIAIAPSTFGDLKLTNSTCQNTTAIKFANKEELLIYPNPTNGELMITSNQIINKIQVYSASGKLVFAKNNLNVKVKELDVSHLSKGIYTIKVYEQDKLIEKKIIKQ